MTDSTDPAAPRGPSGQPWTWLVVGGCPRSGTTLLQRLLNTHPQIRTSNEVSLARLAEALKPVFARERSFAKAIERAKSGKENWTKETLAPFIPRYAQCAGPMLRTMYEAHFGAQVDLGAVRYLGDKYPRYYEDDLDALADVVGPLHLLHVSRDPVDVVNSMLRRSRNASLNLDRWTLVNTVEEGCVHWARAWDFVQRETRRGRHRLTHLRYEDLLHRTPMAMQALAGALGVDARFDTSMLVTHSDDERDIVTADDIRRIDELLGGLPARWGEPMAQLGAAYPTLSLAPGPGQEPA